MRYFTPLIRGFVVFILFSCNRTSYNPEVAFNVLLEQSIPNSDCTNYLFPIKNFVSNKVDSSTYPVLFEDIMSKQMLKCEIYKDSVYFLHTANVDSTIWPVNKLYAPHDFFYCFNHNTYSLSYQKFKGAAIQAYQLDQKYGLINLLSGYEENRISCILMDNASKTIGYGTTKERLEYYQKVKPILMINILPDSIEYRAFGYWPKEYVNTGNTYEDPYAKACFGFKTDVCVSFGADHNLYLYNDTVLQYSKQNKSNYISNFEPYPDDKQFDMLYLREYMQKEPKYMDIIYDPWKRLYYRIVKHPFLNSTTGSKVERFWSVIITDDRLNTIGECKLSIQYDSNVFIPTPFGILLMKGNFPDSKERILTLIKISAHE